MRYHQSIYTEKFITRFWSKVHKSDSCWNWTASIFKKGYGKFSVARGITGKAHQIAFELCNGPIPKGMHVLHSCDNKKCVNPTHLRLGTDLENKREMFERGLIVHDTKGRFASPERG